MNVDPTWDIDEIMMNVLCVWKYYMDKSGYLEKLSRSMYDRLIECNRNRWSLDKVLKLLIVIIFIQLKAGYLFYALLFKIQNNKVS